nr:MAG TPA: hypothetical protein [Caudoviricetes sp.]
MSHYIIDSPNRTYILLFFEKSMKMPCHLVFITI